MRKLTAFSVGFTLVLLFTLSDINPWGLALAVTGVVAVVFCRLPTREPKYITKHLPYVLVGMVFVVGYGSLYQQIFHQPLEVYQDQEVYLTGVVLDYPQWEKYSYSVLVGAQLEGVAETKTLLYIDEQAEGLKPGDRFAIMAKLRSAETTFDGAEITYYTAKGILLRGTTSGVLEVMPVENVPLRHWPAYLAQALKDGIYQVFSVEVAGVIQALVTGNRDELTEGFASSLKRTGLSHTVAVSGMHLAFLAGMIRLLLPKGRKSSTVILIVLVGIFVLISGSTPSIMRAGVMVVMLQIAPLFDRERDDATALATALLVILLVNPYAVTHVGLHLSFASVLGILLFSQKIQDHLQEKVFRLCRKEDSADETLKWKHFGLWAYPLRFVLSSFSATMGAMVITTPLVAYYFGSVSLISPLSNLMTLPAISFAFAGGMISGTLGCVLPWLGRIIGYTVVPVVGYLDWAVEQLGKSLFAAVTMESIYYQVWLVFVYVVLALWLVLPEKKRFILPTCLCFCSFLLSAILHRESFFHQGLTVQVLDVGQGQCVLMTLGQELIVADCGGDVYGGAGNLAADAIQNLGRNSLEMLILSHCDSDHADGVTLLMDRVHVELIVMPVGDSMNPIQRDIAMKARETATEIWYIEEYTATHLGDEKYVRLYPSGNTKNINEAGVIALVSNGSQDILFMGDVGTETELSLLADYPLPKVEMLMVGHHGSKYSTCPELLQAIDPDMALISAGEGNSYGHPTSEAMSRLYWEDVDIYRTDTMGSLLIQAPQGG